MNKSTTIFTRIFSAMAIACAMAAINAPPAAAQSAKNLKCNGCVNSNDIKDKTIKSRDLRTPTALCFDDTPKSDSSITAADEIVASLTCKLPGPGVVIVTASGKVGLSGDDARGQCSITKIAQLEPQRNFFAGGTPYASNGGGTFFMPFSTTRGFAEPAKGNQTYNLVCEQFDDDFNVEGVLMTGIYSATNITVPQP